VLVQPAKHFFIQIDADLLPACASAFRLLHKDANLAGRPFDPRLAQIERELTLAAQAGLRLEPEPRFLTTDEAAAALNISPRRVRQLHKDLGGEKIRGSWYFSTLDVADYRQWKLTAPGRKPGRKSNGT
jgi:hypothetical protein